MNPGLIGLSGIEGLGQDWTPPQEIWAEADCRKAGGEWDFESKTCSMLPPSSETFQMKTWPDLTASPTVTKVAKGLAYAGATLGGAYYYGWKGGVAGFFGSAAASSAAGALVYHRQPEPAYKLAWVLTAGLGVVAAAIAIPSWVMAERVR
jgi:hypothetical protein